MGHEGERLFKFDLQMLPINFRHFFPTVKNPSKFAPTRIWTQTQLYKKGEFEPLYMCHALPLHFIHLKLRKIKKAKILISLLIHKAFITASSFDLTIHQIGVDIMINGQMAILLMAKIW